MESENIDEILHIFNQIDIEDNVNNAKSNKTNFKLNRYKLLPKLRRIFPNPIDFEKYVRENCKNKYKILDRSTFHQIQLPIVIFFNHFREKCVYHTKWLDRIYQLALTYGDRIEFIAADMSDMDLIYPECNPYNFYCRLVRPEDETPYTFVIDEKKRTYYDACQSVETLSELCENLLKENLYPSQPLPENNDTNLVKICVHDNYEELVLKSTRDIFFIVDLGKCPINDEYDPNYENDEYEPNYENVALQLKDYNVDIVYMEAEVNYVPFEYNANEYPTIVFIPHNDKKNFIYFEDHRTEENIVAFLKNIIGKPNILKLKLEEQQSNPSINQQNSKKPLIVPNDFEIDFDKLPQFLIENYDNRIHVLERKTLNKNRLCIVIVYMNFQGKCLARHVQWLNKINLIAERSIAIKFLVADFEDIDLINTKWTSSTFINNTLKPEDEIPKIFAIDFCKHTYEFANFTTVASLFYFTSSLTSGDFYYSQCYPKNQDHQLVKTCVADSLNIFIKQSKKHLFVTFYESDHENTEELLQVLEDVAERLKDFNIEVVKFDVRENYVDLEYAHPTYPVHYFIPRHKKKENYRYINKDLNREEFVEFVKMSV